MLDASFHPYDPLRFWSRLSPERVALVDRERDQRLTYAELDEEVTRWTRFLHAAGVEHGQRVATLAGNRSELVALFFACGRLGVALVPLNWRLSGVELQPVLADAAPVLLLGEGRYRGLAEAALADGAPVRWVDLDDEAPRLLEQRTVPEPEAVVQAEDPVLILYTSGSTGQPKGAILPHRQILFNAVGTTTAWQLGCDDIAPVSTPFFHTGGWNVFATPLWHRGGTVVLTERFEPDAFLAMLAEERCSVAMAVPTQLLMLQESPRWGEALPSLRFLVSGGAPCPPRVAERVRAAGYAFREGYGLTECGPNCFATSDTEAARRPGSVGWPVPFLEMRLAAEDGSAAPPDEPGELWLRGPQLFAGYLNQPERTAEAVTAGGWLRTGDLAVQDADGAYRICGRRKEMYISGGENVFPGEIEAALLDCPGVAEVAVLGVPDPRWGEVGLAVVVRRPDSPLQEEEVIGYARARLAGYKVPKRVAIVEQVPRLGSGKLDRRALHAMLTE